MNAAALPLSHTTAELIFPNEDGTMTKCPFQRLEDAELTAAFLAKLRPDVEFVARELTPVLPAFRGKV